MRTTTVFVCVLAVVVAGCYESTTPLAPATQAIADSALTGRWTCTSPREPGTMTVTFSESRPREYAIELADPDARNTTERLRGFVTRVGSETFLNLQQIDGSDLITTNQYAFVRYRHESDKSMEMDWLEERTSSGDKFTPLLHCVR